MSQPPPPVPPKIPGDQPFGYGPPAPPQTNGAAIASLVSGLLMCIPVLPGIAAIIFGVLGLRRSREPNAGGRGMSIAGITLGVLSLLLWAGLGIAFYRGYQYARPAINATGAFMRDVSTGSFDRILERSDLQPADLERIRQEVEPLGPYQDMSLRRAETDEQNGEMRLRMGGTVRYAKGERPFEVVLVPRDGDFVIERVQVGDVVAE